MPEAMVETDTDENSLIPTAGSSEEPLLQRLANIADSLRKSERKVAEMVAEKPEFFMHSTMAAVAEAAGVSEPTVMRFCTGLGFDGFQSFKLALAQALALGIPATHSAIDDDDSVPELITKIFDHTLTSLDRARRNLDIPSIEEAVKHLLAAEQILFIGFGASGIIATDAAQNFSLFGVPCMAPADAHQQFMAAAMSGPGTVLVAISNTGRTQSVIQVAKQARRNGATIITITGGDGPLLAESDVRIVAKTFEDTDIYTPTVSRLAGLVIIDILATSVASQRGSEHLKKVRAMKDGLASFRTRDRLPAS
jgi:RpiR family carbohydrate utilization transcriptional regulator